MTLLTVFHIAAYYTRALLLLLLLQFHLQTRVVWPDAPKKRILFIRNFFFSFVYRCHVVYAYERVRT